MHDFMDKGRQMSLCWYSQEREKEEEERGRGKERERESKRTSRCTSTNPWHFEGEVTVKRLGLSSLSRLYRTGRENLIHLHSDRLKFPKDVASEGDKKILLSVRLTQLVVRN